MLCLTPKHKWPLWQLLRSFRVLPLVLLLLFVWNPTPVCRCSIKCGISSLWGRQNLYLIYKADQASLRWCTLEKLTHNSGQAKNSHPELWPGHWAQISTSRRCIQLFASAVPISHMWGKTVILTRYQQHRCCSQSQEGKLATKAGFCKCAS